MAGIASPLMSTGLEVFAATDPVWKVCFHISGVKKSICSHRVWSMLDGKAIIALP
jgi:hypothetical protein